MPAGAPKIQIPRWIQLVGLPLLLILLWVVAGAVRHVVFLFLVASVIALGLNPIVKALTRVRAPRGVAVTVVYLTFAACIVAAIVGLVTVLVGETRTAADRLDAYFTAPHGASGQTNADRDVDRLQKWLDDHGLGSIDVQERGHDLVRQIREKDVDQYADDVVRFLEGAAISVGEALFAAVLIIVVSIYMLLDMPRLARSLDRRFPPTPAGRPLLTRMEYAVAGYVKGQLLVSLIIGASAGFGMWVLGALGAPEGADRYALLFGAWVAVTELIPYIGPWLGAIPAGIYALVVDPVSLIWVTILFLFIHQIEGHVVIPNVMGSALRLHPLLVIFGLLAGGEIYGFPGILLALPLLSAGRAAWEFFGERITLEPWETGAGGPVPVEVEIETPAGRSPPQPAVDAAAGDGVAEAETQVIAPPERPASSGRG
jgi:predicted PurR-regulated permease PerM